MGYLGYANREFDGSFGVKPNDRIAVNKSEEMLKLLEECYKDTAKFFRVFLPENFYLPFSPLHKQILDMIDERKPRKKLAVCATRGIGKTTMARGVAAKSICYGDANFIMYVSNSATSAEMQTENLKKDLLSSDIKECFGDVRTKNLEDVDESWSKKAWVANIAGGSHYTLVLPRGSGQQVRGLVWKNPLGKNLRPDLIIFDDLEDTETIENDEQRRKRKEWFYGDAMKCFPRIETAWFSFYIDTPKHDDSLILGLLEASDWDSIRISICDDNYKSLAPDFMSDEDIQEELRIHREQGMMDVFAREFMSMSISKEDAIFKPSYFHYYSESDEDFIKQKNNMAGVVILDPAKTAKMHSAESGFVVWGINLMTGKLYLRYAVGEKLHPDELFDRAIELCMSYNINVLGIETTGIKEFITYPLTNEIVRRGLSIEVIELNAKKGQGEFAGVGGGKKMRISSLSSYYRRGMILHEKSMCSAFETQLLDFPRGKRKDIIDAGAYITEMLDVGGRFFFPPGFEDESEESIEAEYKEIMVEDEEDDFVYEGICP